MKVLSVEDSSYFYKIFPPPSLSPVSCPTLCALIVMFSIVPCELLLMVCVGVTMYIASIYSFILYCQYL